MSSLTLELPIQLETMVVMTQEQANQERLMGSPTVLVNGVDLDPSMRNKTSFGFS